MTLILLFLCWFALKFCYPDPPSDRIPLAIQPSSPAHPLHPHFADELKGTLIKYETIIDQLKNVSQNEYSRHRSPTNFLVNLVCGLIAYGHQDKRPAFREDPTILQAA